MCTAITYSTKDHYFGRNLDLAYSYSETVTVTPRRYLFRFRQGTFLPSHFAMIGMAYVVDGYPLYYDAVNEHGLAMAGLNFPGNAVYFAHKPDADNIAPFEFIPWVLSQCRTVAEAKVRLERLNLWDVPFSDALPLSPLHWIVADKESSITVESVRDGLKIYDNPVGVLTNNPPFDFMMPYLTLFRDLRATPSENRLASDIDLPLYCCGIGTVGLPGDYASPSRFVRATFVKQNSLSPETEAESVSQFFHILASVEMPRGCVRLEDGENDITVYSCCVNQDTGVYYYVTYDNRQIFAVDMHRENLDGMETVSYPLVRQSSISLQN